MSAMLVRSNKNYFLVCSILSVLVFTVYQIIPMNRSSVFHEWPTGRNGVRYILYWDSMWNVGDFELGFGSEIFKNCPLQNCITTKNRTLIPIEEFDALVFHGAEPPREKPPKRNSNQVYIYFNLESPFNTPPNLKYLYGFFNWTLSYRSDADIFRPYGWIIRNSTGYKMPTIEEIQKKEKKIAWFVSHCGVASQRDMFARKINQHMKVDIYGKCGNLTCPRNQWDECYNMMEKNYKFYLSFENSVCKDYVTEKMFNILTKNVVPIVYGGADYDNIAPPHSVIDATKFKTVKELVKYLKFLDENPEEYLKYFEWKKDFYSFTKPQQALCQLCSKLNEPRKKTIYGDIIAWLNNPEYCKSGDKLPPIVFS